MIVNKLLYYFIIFNIIISCDKKKPSIVFFPDMYYSVAYDPYQEAVQPYINKSNSVPLFKKMNGKTFLNPVKGSIARNIENILPLELDNSNQGYEMSKKIITSPIPKSIKFTKIIENGKKLYEQNCLVCHGVNGDGNGPIVNSGAYNGVPKYSDRDISIGSIYYVITYGKNAMGSYAANMNIIDRWYISEYIINNFKRKN